MNCLEKIYMKNFNKYLIKAIFSNLKRWKVPVFIHANSPLNLMKKAMKIDLNPTLYVIRSLFKRVN